MYDMKLLGKRVMMSRYDLNVNQLELSDRSGVSNTYISDIERGRARKVGVDVVFALAEALQVNPAYLLGLTDAPSGESDVRVMKEMAGEYVTVDVDSDEERRLVRSLMDEFNALPRRAQQAAIEMVRLLRRMESDEPLADDEELG
jgi:transcriptional regulator with XRE-family HTH domain